MVTGPIYPKPLPILRDIIAIIFFVAIYSYVFAAWLTKIKREEGRPPSFRHYSCPPPIESEIGWQSELIERRQSDVIWHMTLDIDQ